MTSRIDMSSAHPDEHARRARLARVLLRAEARYRRRARWYELGRRLPEDTTDRAILLIDADRLVRDLARARS